MAKSRAIQTAVIPIARTDSATEKFTLPKGSVPISVEINQTVSASTAAGSFILGKAGDTNALIEAFSMATTKVGLVGPGVSAGVDLGTKMTADTKVISTYTVGSSTAGGTGYVLLHYYFPGPGEDDLA